MMMMKDELNAEIMNSQIEWEELLSSSSVVIVVVNALGCAMSGRPAEQS